MDFFSEEFDKDTRFSFFLQAVEDWGGDSIIAKVNYSKVNLYASEGCYTSGITCNC